MTRTKVIYAASTSKRVLCHCPLCGKDHIHRFEYGYTGDIVKPRKFCKSCEGRAESGSEKDLQGIMKKGNKPKDPFPQTNKSGKNIYIGNNKS